ncbi:hypothetical protein [Pseudonocardia sp. ICBG1293]|uniref:hypothetical protein n=1 Tax=Pseudonocardia sp. ICBG1293 TaxID=2844382 RepID=UPI001CCC87A9|nr:hypothetical protein [Pseudonocardia sp. ICBG1293]
MLGADRESARPQARAFVAMAAGAEGSPYGANLRRLGFDEQDVRDGADAVVEAVVAFGTPADVAQRVRAHQDAGADHVRLDPVVDDFEAGVGRLEQLGPLLADPEH